MSGEYSGSVPPGAHPPDSQAPPSADPVAPGERPGRSRWAVLSAERGTEIVVISATFRKVARGIGTLRVVLAPGIYKARFKAGDRSQDKLFEVPDGEADGELTIAGPHLAFSSPIPLATVSNTHEYQRYPAKALREGNATRFVGTGAQLLVFARDSAHAHGSSFPHEPPWQGLALHQVAHEPCDIAPHGTEDLASGFLGAKVEAGAGVYFLSQPEWGRPGWRLELPIVLCEGWCTHVYLDAREVSVREEATPRRLDLAGAAIVMTRIGAADPVDIDARGRLSEIARQSFLHGQDVISAEDLELMVAGKLDFPMFGIYAAHALVARADPDWQRVTRIAQHLDSLLVSGHPDLDVLLRAGRRALGRAEESWTPRLWPPMLAASWDLAHKDGGLRLDAATSALSQYRLYGSMWNGTLRPMSVAQAPASSPVSAPPAAPSVFGWDAAVLAALEPFARGVVKTVVDVAAQAVRMPLMPTADTAFDAALSLWEALAPALKHLSSQLTPFQQVLRRRLLDMLSDRDDEQALDLGALAEQFHIPLSIAIEALVELRSTAEAVASREDSNGA